MYYRSIFIIIILIICLNSVIYVSSGENWSGECFTPDTQTFKENSWRLDANCENSAKMQGYVYGPGLIKFKWRKSISYGSAFEFSMKISGTKNQLVCPSFDKWNEISAYIFDDEKHEVTWTYTKVPTAENYCKMDSSAWIKDIVTPGISNTKITLPNNTNSSRLIIPAANTNLRYYNLTSKNFSFKMNTLNFYINTSNLIVNAQNATEKLPVGNSEFMKPKDKSSLVVKLIWPKNGTVLPLKVPIEFNFTTQNSPMIPLCTWFFDDNRTILKNVSRNIHINSYNQFSYIFDEIGIHSWRVSCFDCDGNNNSSNKIFFYVNQKNDTTYVNNEFPIVDRFTYATIKDAINNVTNGGTVRIEKGTYNEQVEIIKPLRLIGTNDSSINREFEPKGCVGIEIKSNDVEISGLKIYNCTYGIQADSRKDIRLINNTISECVKGIKLINSINICVINNTITNCIAGPVGNDYMCNDNPIELIKCKNHYISGTKLENCRKLDDSCKNDTTNSTCSGGINDVQ